VRGCTKDDLVGESPAAGRHFRTLAHRGVVFLESGSNCAWLDNSEASGSRALV
jgi:hypothetical protein